jgi:hypothetical protein
MAVVQRKPCITPGDHDYADAFEIQLSDSDERSAEQLLHAGVGQAPAWMRAVVLAVHRHVLRLNLGPATSPKHVLGWEILTIENDAIRLRAEGPLIGGVLVMRRIPQSSAVLETSVDFRRPALARIVWTVIAPAHRAVARILLAKLGLSARDETTSI